MSTITISMAVTEAQGVLELVAHRLNVDEAIEALLGKGGVR